MIKVADLTLNQLNQLVARFEGIEVMIHRDHVAIEIAFNPETPSNDYDLNAGKMWQFYEPTSDWSIAGPILDRERIALTTYEEDGEQPKYWGAWYGEYLFENTGETACEALIRSFIAKHFGDTIDFDNLPTFKRWAAVQINAFKAAEFFDETDENPEPFAMVEIVVEAETTAEAERLASDEFYESAENENFEILDAYFIRWQ